MEQNDNRSQEVDQGQETTDTDRTCALDRCGKPARRMSRFCSADHNAASANRGGDL
jgi:hypothetical protein